MIVDRTLDSGQLIIPRWYINSRLRRRASFSCAVWSYEKQLPLFPEGPYCSVAVVRDKECAKAWNQAQSCTTQLWSTLFPFPLHLKLAWLLGTKVLQEVRKIRIPRVSSYKLELSTLQREAAKAPLFRWGAQRLCRPKGITSGSLALNELIWVSSLTSAD